MGCVMGCDVRAQGACVRMQDQSPSHVAAPVTHMHAKWAKAGSVRAAPALVMGEARTLGLGIQASRARVRTAGLGARKLNEMKWGPAARSSSPFVWPSAAAGGKAGGGDGAIR